MSDIATARTELPQKLLSVLEEFHIQNPELFCDDIAIIARQTSDGRLDLISLKVRIIVQSH